MGKCLNSSGNYVEKLGICPLFLVLLETSAGEIYMSNTPLDVTYLMI